MGDQKINEGMFYGSDHHVVGGRVQRIVAGTKTNHQPEEEKPV
jgi:hypothetical protein